MPLNQTVAAPLTEVEDWIASRFASELHRSMDAIKRDEPILSLGIDSVQILCVMTQIEDWGGFRFPENPLEHCATIAELAQYVTELVEKKAE